jgi:hypothetical protein
MRHSTGRQPIFEDTNQNEQDETIDVSGVNDAQMKENIAKVKENIKNALKKTNMVLQDARDLNHMKEHLILKHTSALNFLIKPFIKEYVAIEIYGKP